MKDSASKLKKHMAIASIVLGMLLLLYMIIVEDEPGALPLALILLGGGDLAWENV